MGVVISGLGDVHRLTHDPAEARAMYERAITLMRTRSEPAWNMPKSLPLLGLAKLELELGHPGMAINFAEQALALRSSDQPPITPIRYQAQSRLVLAQALWDAPPDAGRDREHAVALAEKALAMLAGESNNEAERDAQQAWLRERPL
jgi:tetratricopeptide (TPR) repeat protein